MKITSEQLNDYIDFVKKNFNRDLSTNEAYEEFYKLITLVAHLFLPVEITKLLEIKSEVRYTKSAIHSGTSVLNRVVKKEYNKG